MERIVELLSQRDTVLFVGSGISLWSGLPTWGALIEELAEFVAKAGGDPGLIRAEAKRGDFLQAASYGFDTLTKPQIGEFIRSACRYGLARPHDIHRIIVSLGPSCFITSNYDNLLEESLRVWRSDEFFRPPVTNRNLTALGEIIHASSVNFIFKPHGDASDTDSIVLTREQYRDLLPGGERYAALESARLLLASRPVIYLGFGLRDPDFIYVRDLLSNTYKGGARDHYAIVANVTPPEIQWWRKNYGVHLIGYSAAQTPDGREDHSALIPLLGALSDASRRAPRNPTAAPLPQLLLSLARHASRLSRHQKIDPELPIRVTREDHASPNTLFWRQHNDFDYLPVNKFLTDGPNKAVLLGLPGSGKSYAVARAAAYLADQLHRLCLDENPIESAIVVPVLIDMKIYKGHLRGLIEESLPTGILSVISERKWKIKVFLDSFNEMPRQHTETQEYESDFTRTFRDLDMSTIIASRTNDGLSNFGFPAYSLDQIDLEYLNAELGRRSISIGGRFKEEILRLLQKPFYFQLCINRAVTLSGAPHPRDVFDGFFSSLISMFHARFPCRINLISCLQRTAYNSIDQGQEAWPLQFLLQRIRDDVVELGETIVPEDIANWLVSMEILIPYTGGRVAFFHQSVTEFLAASELARLFQHNPGGLATQLAFTRWDQALFLTLSLLPAEKSSEFLNAIIRMDYILALNASKYLEFDRDSVVGKLLEQLPDNLDDDFDRSRQISFALERGLPVTIAHEGALRRLLNLGNMIGGAAAIRLVEVLGDNVKGDLIRSLYDRRQDFNYCVNGIAPALASRVNADDLPALQMIVDAASDEVSPGADEDVVHGLICGVAALLSAIDLCAIKRTFLPKEGVPIPEVRARVLCNLVRDLRSTEGLQLATEMLLRGVDQAAVAIFFVANFAGKEQVDFGVIDGRHIDKLIALIQHQTADTWAQRALTEICAVRLDLQEIVASRSEAGSGLYRVALLVASGTPMRWDALWQELARIARPDTMAPSTEDRQYIENMEIDWTGHEQLLMGLLKRRDTSLALALLENIVDVGTLDFGSIDWVLEWLHDERAGENQFMFYDRISLLIEGKAQPDLRQAFLDEFNSSRSIYLDVLASSILLARSDLTTDMFSEHAISFLLSQLGSTRGHHPRETLLGRCATESFVENNLIGLLANTSEPFYSSLRRVLDNAGKRHGRRYIRT